MSIFLDAKHQDLQDRLQASIIHTPCLCGLSGCTSTSWDQTALAQTLGWAQGQGFGQAVLDWAVKAGGWVDMDPPAPDDWDD